MSTFIKTFIADEDYGGWLAKALFEVVDCDPSITTELFYIEGSTQPYDKKHLLALDEIELPSFLLGVWHFIVVNRRNNKVGADTIEAWHKKPAASRAKHEFISDIGRNWPRKINVSLESFIQPASVDYDFGEITDESDENDDLLGVILPGQDIAPEITGDPDDILYISKKDFYGPKREFAEYLDNAEEKYNMMKTLLYNDSPRKFYDFYVCNNISGLHQEVHISNQDYFRCNS